MLSTTFIEDLWNGLKLGLIILIVIPAVIGIVIVLFQEVINKKK